MRILVANYRYFMSGGPERYMFNISEALTERGHGIIPFSVGYARNLPSPYARLFVEPSGGQDEIYFREQRLTLHTFWRTTQRLFYAPDVEGAVQNAVLHTRPQIAYVLNYLRKLSPSLLVGLKRTGVPVVVRLSDYAMLCPRAVCWRGGNACVLCTRGNLWPSIRYGCVRDSQAISALNALATWYHRARRYFDLVDIFVTTTQFMYTMMRDAGFPERRLRYIPTFVDTDVFRPPREGNDPLPAYLAYVGRLDEDKGLHVLLQAWQRLKAERPGDKIRLKVAGAGHSDYTHYLASQASNDVDFLGSLARDEVAELLRHAYLAVVPSLGYDNLPNALLESYASGTPVLASDLGSFRETVLPGKTGFLFEAGNATALAEILGSCLDSPQRVAAMARQARDLALAQYGREAHVLELEALFSELVGERGER